MGRIRIGPARVPDRESPEEAVTLLQERGFTACEIDFEGKFWMDYDFAARLGELARERRVEEEHRQYRCDGQSDDEPRR